MVFSAICLEMRGGGSAKALVNAQQPIGKNNPAPAWGKHDHEGHRQANQPAKEKNRFTAVSRVRFVAGARTLGLSLDDIGELLALRDRREAPCRVLLQMLNEKAAEIRQRIAELQRLEVELRELHALGLTFPTDTLISVFRQPKEQ